MAKFAHSHLLPRLFVMCKKSGLIFVLAKVLKTPCVPSKTVRGPINPDFAIFADCQPQPAAHPGCRRFVEVPSAKYSIIPEAMLPTIPRAEVICFCEQPILDEIPADDPNAPNIAVG